MPEKDIKNDKYSLIKMTLEGVRMEHPSLKPIILLKEENGDRLLPIWVGAFEASAIALALSNFKTPRPMTHDLIINLLRDLNCNTNFVSISKILDETFYAVLNIETTEKKIIEIDLRPSDAIAIAVRADCEIFASAEVLSSAGLKITSIEEEIEKFKDFLDHTNPEDFNI